MPRPPAVEAQDYQTRECDVEASQIVTYPSPVGSFKRIPEIAELVSKFKDPQKAYRRAVKRLGYREDFGTRVFGYPSWIHDNTLDDDELLFVAQIGSENSANLMFGDAGLLYIAATKTVPVRFETDLWQCF